MNKHTPSRTFAWVVLTGANGRQTRLEIRTKRDVVTRGASEIADPRARIAFAGIDSSDVRDGVPVWARTDVYAVTLEVPSTVGPIRSLRFEVADGTLEVPLLYAATLERESTQHTK
jgi:hypothetical protein